MLLSIRQGPSVHSVKLEPGDTVASLMQQLEDLTGVFVRKQKLIFKGKVLAPSNVLTEIKGLKDGSVLMLVTAAGQMTQGQAAAAQNAASQLQKFSDSDRAQAPTLSVTWQDRAKVWAKTGVVSTRDSGLSHLPPEALGLSSPVRVLDASNNRLEELPAGLASIAQHVNRLIASHNQLQHQRMPGLASLTNLRTLLLDHNQLQQVPSEMTSLRALEHLSLSHNQLQSLEGSCIAPLIMLQRLELQHNQLTSVPSECGSLTSLQELNAAHNQLQSLPTTLGQLTCLRSLLLDHNRLPTVPKEILKGCSNLALLSLHDNPLTADQLREAQGFAALDGRRQLRIGKKLDMHVMAASEGFSEGADTQDR